MIHHLIDDKYQLIQDEWISFLESHQFDENIEIYYDNPHPVFVDAEKRKFQIDFENDRKNYSKFKSGRTTEPLSRALGSGKIGNKVLDLSAGLGIDAVFLAQLAFRVTALERNPLIFLALQNAHKNLTGHYRDHLRFIFGDAKIFLNRSEENFDMAYFDPMFPEKNKSALPKQEMIFFKNLVGADEDAVEILDLALKTKKFKRVVVKRPLAAPALMSQEFKPTGQIKGKIIRYDIYTS